MAAAVSAVTSRQMSQRCPSLSSTWRSSWETVKKQAVVRKHNKPRPRVAHRGIARFIKIEQRCNHCRSTPSLKFSCKSVHPFSRNLANKETKIWNKDTYKQRNRSKTIPRPPIYRGQGNDKQHFFRLTLMEAIEYKEKGKEEKLERWMQ